MHSFDSLLESDPEIQQIKVEAQQKVFMVVVKTRFPSLVQQAQQKVVHRHKEDDLYRLTELMAGAPDEKTAHWVLNTFAA
jgi:isocitrate dehydrogenase